MDFALTAEQEAFVAVVRDFSSKRVAPLVRDYDRDEYVPSHLLKELAELGVLGGVIPADYGGSGMDYLTTTLAIEELSRADHALAAFVSAPSGLVGAGLLAYGTEEQKQKYLAPLARGECVAGAAVTEPRSGTDVAGMTTRVRKNGGEYILSGEKTWISNLVDARWFLTFAQSDPAKGRHGICAFIVDRDTPGLSVRPIKNKTGFRPIPSGQVLFDDVRVPTENIVGEEGEGFRVSMCAVENGRLFVAARAVGVLQACLDEVLDYASTRETFGTQIGHHQLIQAKIADIAVAVETARLLTYRLAWLKDHDHRARVESSMAKMYASDALMRSATEAAQVFGAYMASDEYAVGRHFRDAKIFQIVEGTNEIHRILIAETLLGYRKS
jgi:glutaryl-CoA dehydrogenase (non-decarboxylating)